MNRVFILGIVLAQFVTVATLAAAEYHGTVKSGGLPIPGAAVTATQGEKKLTTTTDEQGVYSFPNLENGAWTISVEMLGFGKITREVTIASAATAAEWDLKLSPFESAKPESAAAAGKQPNAPANNAAGSQKATAKNGSAPNQPNSGGRSRGTQAGNPAGHINAWT